MGFTLPHTRLAFKHLRPLSCQRLWSPATLTTWISLLYMRLTDPLELRDAILTWILILIIYTTHHHEISPRDSWNYAYLTSISCSSYHNHHLLSQHSILIQVLNQPNKIHVLLMLTYQLQFIGPSNSCFATYFNL